MNILEVDHAWKILWSKEMFFNMFFKKQYFIEFREHGTSRYAFLTFGITYISTGSKYIGYKL